jgi:hypothetical protein
MNVYAERLCSPDCICGEHRPLDEHLCSRFVDISKLYAHHSPQTLIFKKKKSQIVVAGNTFLYICFYFSLGRRTLLISPSSLRYIANDKMFPIVYSNSLLATLNARNMIRAAANNNTENLSLSLRESSGISKVRPYFSSSFPQANSVEN